MGAGRTRPYPNLAAVGDTVGGKQAKTNLGMA